MVNKIAQNSFLAERMRKPNYETYLIKVYSNEFDWKNKIFLEYWIESKIKATDFYVLHTAQ